MGQEKNKQISKEWHEAFGSENLKDKYDRFLDDDFTADFFGQQLNKVQYIYQYQMFSKAFTANNIIVLEQLAETDKVASVILWEGFHSGNTNGMPVEGKSISIKGITLDYFKNGKVIKHYPVFDTALLLPVFKQIKDSENAAFISNTFKLTDREKEVWCYLLDGCQYKSIADKMQISFDTVHSHIKNIYKKLEVNSLSEAIAKVIRVRQ